MVPRPLGLPGRPPATPGEASQARRREAARSGPAALPSWAFPMRGQARGCGRVGPLGLFTDHGSAAAGRAACPATSLPPDDSPSPRLLFLPPPGWGVGFRSRSAVGPKYLGPSPQVGAGPQTSVPWPLPLRLPRWPSLVAFSKKVKMGGDGGGLGRRSWNSWQDRLALSLAITMVPCNSLLFSPLWFGVGRFTDKRTVMNTCVKHKGPAV